MTVVAAGNAVGSIIPPFIIFKGKWKNTEWKDLLPPGSDVEMMEKGSMTAETFVKYVRHFALYKPRGKPIFQVSAGFTHDELKNCMKNFNFIYRN